MVLFIKTSNPGKYKDKKKPIKLGIDEFVFYPNHKHNRTIFINYDDALILNDSIINDIIFNNISDKRNKILKKFAVGIKGLWLI